MTIIKHRHGCVGSTDFKAEVPFVQQPKIQSEKVIKGVRYYFGNGKRYVADLFDLMFKTERTKIKSKEYKGKLIGKHFVTEVQ